MHLLGLLYNLVDPWSLLSSCLFAWTYCNPILSENQCSNLVLPVR